MRKQPTTAAGRARCPTGEDDMTYNWLGSVIGEETNPTVRDADIVQPTERIEGELREMYGR